MIWVTDTAGQTMYVCREWYIFTGVRPPDGLGLGRASVIHPDERHLMADTFRHACASRCEFALQYRLRRHDGTYVWVSDSAAPASLPKRKEFLGFIGQITSIEPQLQGLIASAELQRFQVATPVGAFAPITALDALAEHILMARSLALSSAADHLLPSLDELLFAVGKDLARQQSRGDGSGNIH